MPEISRFFGIIIRMYPEPRVQHHRAHFHAYYGKAEAVYAIDSHVELLAGELPRRQRRLVEAWAELHVDELRQDWDLLQIGQLPLPIEPLR